MTATSQIQCPNCGGYNIHIARSPMPTSAGGLLGEMTVPIVLWCLAIVCTFGLALLAFIPWVIYYQNSVKQRRELGNAWVYQCNLCGYSWQWTPGTPLPQVTVRQDLIQAGQKRIQEEEERRRRAQD